MEHFVGAVRWLQANRVPDRHGHEWLQWLEQNEKGVLRDPARWVAMSFKREEGLKGFARQESDGN